MGIDGDDWVAAATKVSRELDLQIPTFKIGQGQENTDLYQDWQQLCEVEENGCLLIRPDRTIGWRSKTAIQEPAARLASVLKAILAL